MNKLNEKAIELKLNLDRGFEKSRKIINDKGGAGTFDSAIQIVIAVSLGALLYVGLEALLSGTVMGGISDKITAIFGFGSNN